MTVKLAILKSGEDIVADIKEMLVGDEDTPAEQKKVVGYVLTKPCGVTLNSKAIKLDDEEEDHYQIKIFPWCPLSKNTEIPISADWVVTLVDPIDKVKQMYETEVLKDATSKGSSTNEQSDSSKSD